MILGPASTPGLNITTLRIYAKYEHQERSGAHIEKAATF